MSRITPLSLGALLLLFFALAAAPHRSEAAQIQVQMVNNAFVPSSVSIAPGDTIVWRNTDSMAHNVTGNDGSFTSGTIQPGGTYSRTFTSAGVLQYNCTFHPGMNGTVNVVNVVNSPAPTSSNVDELRARAQALLLKVQQLQAQYGTNPNSGVGPNVVIDSSSCPLIGRSLKIGASGDDVTRLQQFLARDYSIYPEGKVTGYYGALTEAAVKRWQVKYNIVSSGSAESTGYGVVGPRTAAAIALLCTTGSYGGVPGPSGGSAPVGGFIQVTPVSGNAPLDVGVQATVNTVNSCSGATYMVDYGDGTQPSQIVVPAGNCAQMVQNLAHRYPYGGTFAVTLSAGAHKTQAVVQVFGQAAPTPTPAPSPAPTPTPTPPPPSPSKEWGIVSVGPGTAEFGITVELVFPACAGYTVRWGDGSSSTRQSPAGCSETGATASSNENHTYGAPGQYTISLVSPGGAVKATSGTTIVAD